MKYVFLDTCTIVDCAFTRTEKSSPKLLKRLMKWLEDNHVKFILPEVVQLELEKVLPQTMANAAKSFGSVKKSVREVVHDSLLSHSAETRLLDAVKAARGELENDVNDAQNLIRGISHEPEKCVVLPLAQEDLISAIKMSIPGDKPSKPKTQWGLVQEDCLIVAALERFMKGEPDAEIAICSSNTADFATKASDGESLVLHEQIASRFGNCRFYSSPVDLMADKTFMCKEYAEMSDKETLKSSYEATSEAIRTMNAASIDTDLRKLAEMGLSKKYSDASDQLSSALLRHNLATDSIGRNADLVLQSQAAALRLLGEVMAASRAGQIGNIHSALENVGYDEADKEDIEDDAE